MKEDRPATLQDIAALAGVSMMTVSRALREPRLVSAETLQKVRAAVAKTSYVRNALAGGLRSSRTRLVAALVPAIRSHIHDTLIQALTTSLARHGYELLLGQTGHSTEREEDLLRTILARRPDGIVVTGVVHSRGSRLLLLSAKIPIVETNDWTDSPIDLLVGFSHDRMGADACRFLHSKGRRRLAVITGDDDRAMRRTKSFVSAARALKLASPRIETLPAPTNHAGGRQALARLLDGARGEIDGLYCGSDMVALGVLTEARVRGLEVPGSLSVVGSGDMDFASSVVPSLTSVRVDFVHMGELAAQLVIDRLEGRALAQTSVDIGYDIVERESA